MSDNGFRISSERTGTTTRVTVMGELDLASAPQLREHMTAQLADHSEIIVLDLGDVSFIDSTGLHALIDASSQDGKRLRVIPNPALLRLLEITGLRDRLPLIDDRSG